MQRQFNAPGEDIIVSFPSDCDQLDLDAVQDRLILGDANQVLPSLPPGIADCVFFDPPYYLQLPARQLRRWNVKTVVQGVEDDWDKFASFDEYDDFIARNLTQLKRLMKPQATIWVIGTYHNIFRIGRLMQDLGFWILNDVIWLKTNPMPNWLGVRFTNATETLIWATRERLSSRDYTFHRDFAKEVGIGRVGANVWEIPICAGKERLKDGQGQKVHSTQKPEELLRRVILSSTNEGDLILDPMAGVGTTGAVCARYRRHFILVEKNQVYAEAAARRLSMLQLQP